MNHIVSKITRRSFLFPFAGVLLGIAGGFLYYHFIGCQNGTCAITSNPWLSMLWGAAVGYLIGDMFSGRKKNNTESVS